MRAVKDLEAGSGCIRRWFGFHWTIALVGIFAPEMLARLSIVKVRGQTVTNCEVWKGTPHVQGSSVGFEPGSIEGRDKVKIHQFCFLGDLPQC